MATKYTEQQLMVMPMKFLKQIDIESIDEERLVQKVLNTRLKSMPSPVAFNIPTHVTDNLTVETEKALQQRIDKVRAKAKNHLTSQGEEGDTPELDPLVPGEQTEESKPEFETNEDVSMKTTTVKFCGFCDAPGPFHKTVCTRPK